MRPSCAETPTGRDHNEPVEILVLSDSHAPLRWRSTPRALTEPLQRCDVIVHAGDVCVPSVLDELAAHAPVHVALGNNDGPDVEQWGARPALRLDIDGLRIGMVHDAGPRAGRGRRMRRLFPDADLVVFGHSHIPLDTVEEGVRLFNPGSVADPRRQPRPSYGWLSVVDGRLVRHDIVEFERPPPRRPR